MSCKRIRLMNGKYASSKQWRREKSLPLVLMGAFAFVTFLLQKPDPIRTNLLMPASILTSQVPVAHAQETHERLSYTYEEAVDYIWLRESSRGKNNIKGSLAWYCEQKGMWNELGYGGMALKHCFKNKAEGWEVVTKWIDKRQKENKDDIEKTLCYYNIGVRGSCEYGKTFEKQHTEVL